MAEQQMNNAAGARSGGVSAGQFDKSAVANILGSLFTDAHPAKATAVEWLGYGGEKLNKATGDQIEKLLNNLVEAGHIDVAEIDAATVPVAAEPQPPAEKPVAASVVALAVTQLTYLTGRHVKDAKSRARITFKDLQNQVDSPQAVPKLKAAWIATSGIITREDGQPRGEVRTDLIGLDCDAMDGKTLAQFALAMSELIRGCDYETHTTASATPTKPKARGYVPLGCLIEDVETLNAVQRVFYRKLAEKGFPIDPLFDIEHIMFMPNRNIDADGFYESQSVREGKRFDPLVEWADEIEAARAYVSPVKEGSATGADDFDKIEPKLRQPGALAALLNRIDPDLEYRDWRNVISCIVLHLGEDGYSDARNWCAKGEKFMLSTGNDKGQQRKLSKPAAEKQFREVWDGIAADGSFCIGGGVLFNILKKQGVMTDADIAAWHEAHRDAGGNVGADDGTRHRVKFMTTKEMLETKDAPRWVLKNWFERNTITCIAGQPKATKSFIAFDMGMHIAAGLPWCGNRVEQGPVFVIAGEGQGGVTRRVKAWHKKHPRHDGIPFHATTKAVTLDHEGAAECAEVISEMCAEHGAKPSMILIDTVARCFPGDENKTEDMAKFVSALDQHLKDMDVAVVIVHHSTKSGSDLLRGSSVLRAALDGLIEVIRSDTPSESGGVLCEVKPHWLKDGATPPTLYFDCEKVAFGVDEDLDPITSLCAVLIGKPQANTADLNESQRSALTILLNMQSPDANVAVKLKEWRGGCATAGVIQGDDAKAIENAMMKKIVEPLLVAGVIFKPEGSAGLYRAVKFASFDDAEG